MITADATSRSPYPFAQFMPFPASCITGLAIGLPEIDGISGLPYASVVTLGYDYASVTVSADIGGTGRVLFSIVCAYGECSISDIYGCGVNARMETGIIPESCHGTYSGRFSLDPSCMFILPAACSGIHSSIDADGTSVPLTGMLSLTFDGLLSPSMSVSGGTATVNIAGTADADGAVTCLYAEGSDVRTVTSVNGGTFSAAGIGNSITFAVGGSVEGVSMAVRSTQPTTSVRKTVILEIRGGTAFPSCYGDKDEA